MQIQVALTVIAPELVGAINNLAAVWGAQASIAAPAAPAAPAPLAPSYPSAVPQQPQTVITSFPPAQPSAVPTYPAQAQPVPVAPPTYPQAGQMPPQAPVQPPAAVPPGAVPTAQPSYTIDQLAVAATALMDSSAEKHAQLTALLNQRFGVPALTMLPKEQYGVFATEIRALGAQI